jgi:hypothetical protein
VEAEELKMATLMKTNGQVIGVTPRNGESFTLEELQDFVGGYIELVRLSEDVVMFVNEEGKLNGLHVNPKATILASAEEAIGPTDIIVGDAVVMTRKEAGEDAAHAER